MTVNAKWVLVGLLFLTITGEHLASEPLNSNARSGMSKVQIQTVLAQSNRSEDDRKRDDQSRPADILNFAGVREGMTVWDILGGGGYYSEITSQLVGLSGLVYLQNNTTYLGFLGTQVEDRLPGNRFPNIHHVVEEGETISFPTNSVDVALMIKTYHDLYWSAEGWQRDPDAFLKSIFRVLKPNGILLVVDHVAQLGTRNNSAQELHRIDPQWAQHDIEKRGFIFDGSIDVLRNRNDNYSLNVFDPSVLGATDRFVYRFRKSQ